MSGLRPPRAAGTAGYAPSNPITMGMIGLHSQGTNVHINTLPGMGEAHI